MRKRNHAEQSLSLARFGFYFNSVEFTNQNAKFYLKKPRVEVKSTSMTDCILKISD